MVKIHLSNCTVYVLFFLNHHTRTNNPLSCQQWVLYLSLNQCGLCLFVIHRLIFNDPVIFFLLSALFDQFSFCWKPDVVFWFSPKGLLTKYVSGQMLTIDDDMGRGCTTNAYIGWQGGDGGLAYAEIKKKITKLDWKIWILIQFIRMYKWTSSNNEFSSNKN